MLYPALAHWYSKYFGKIVRRRIQFTTTIVIATAIRSIKMSQQYDTAPLRNETAEIYGIDLSQHALNTVLGRSLTENRSQAFANSLETLSVPTDLYALTGSATSNDIETR
jgi:hypothetical protein